MMTQLFIGGLLIAMTVSVQALFFGGAIMVLNRFGGTLAKPPIIRKTILSLIAVVLWLMAGHSVGAWIWALSYMVVGAIDALEPALYFSLVTFTTLGYGDITLSSDWRLLSAINAANGLLVFGLSTAFLVEFLSQVTRAQNAHQQTGSVLAKE